ncbi:MAG: hypothetical protein DDT40_00984 [candidate division WS2 bacterium]|nr:hypothetical protein [Candidatus Psychracetigena formicireducens]
MVPGKAKTINSRPTNAGLKRFLPNPPKSCFPTMMAKEAPIAAIYSGKEGDKLRPKSSPVTTALRSLTFIGFFRVNCHSASLATAAATLTMSNHKAGSLKNHSAAMVAGSKANSITRIIFILYSPPS